MEVCTLSHPPCDWQAQFRTEPILGKSKSYDCNCRPLKAEEFHCLPTFYTALTYTCCVATPIRTATFSRRAKHLLSEPEIVSLAESLAERPDAHPIIPGTGGVRKARWARSGMGKRGGVRVVYYLLVRADLVYLLDVYAKNEKADLTAADKRELRAIVSMLEDL